MKLFVCTDHDCVWPVGVASIVLAEDKAQAIKMLDVQLEARGLLPWKDFQYHLNEFPLDQGALAMILRDGDY